MLKHAILFLAVTSCYATSPPPPVSVLETTSATLPLTPVPVEIARAPTGVYGDMTVYLVRERWYYHDAQGRWHTFVEEPDALLAQRHFIQARTNSGQTQ
jgi:hypothetical protein